MWNFAHKSILVCIVLLPVIKGENTPLHQNCQEKAGVTDEIIIRAQNKEFPEDYALKCYLKCLLMDSGVTDEDGTLNFERLEELTPEEIKADLVGTFRKCEGMLSMLPDLCEMAFSRYRCVYDHCQNPETYYVL